MVGDCHCALELRLRSVGYVFCSGLLQQVLAGAGMIPLANNKPLMEWLWCYCE